MALTAKQQAFVDEYLIDLNATQAAIRAGYSENTAAEIGAENLRKPQIAAQIDQARAKRSTETGIDAAWVLKRLEMEADADIADLYAEGGSLKPVHEWPLIWRQGLVAGIDTTRDNDGSVIDKIKLSDRVKRIEMIGRHVGVQAFKERLEVDVTSDLAEMIAKARARRLAD